MVLIVFVYLSICIPKKRESSHIQRRRSVSDDVSQQFGIMPPPTRTVLLRCMSSINAILLLQQTKPQMMWIRSKHMDCPSWCKKKECYVSRGYSMLYCATYHQSKSTHRHKIIIHIVRICIVMSSTMEHDNMTCEERGKGEIETTHS